MKKFPLIILIMTIACITSCKSGGGNLKCNIEPTPTPNIKFYPAENTIQIKGIQKSSNTALCRLFRPAGSHSLP